LAGSGWPNNVGRRGKADEILASDAVFSCQVDEPSTSATYPKGHSKWSEFTRAVSTHTYPTLRTSTASPAISVRRRGGGAPPQLYNSHRDSHASCRTTGRVSVDTVIRATPEPTFIRVIRVTTSLSAHTRVTCRQDVLLSTMLACARAKRTRGILHSIHSVPQGCCSTIVCR
jgi:hypothetical protein